MNRDPINLEDRDILIQLLEYPDNELYDICQKNDNNKRLCNNIDIFWRVKIDRKLGYLAWEKPVDMTYQDYYFSLVLPTESERFEKLFYINENAKQFFREAYLGRLKNNITELAGVTTGLNLSLLMYIYVKLNNLTVVDNNKTYYTTDSLMKKYFYGIPDKFTRQQMDIYFSKNMKGSEVNKNSLLWLKLKNLTDREKVILNQEKNNLI